jgi:hypothetical protein
MSRLVLVALAVGVAASGCQSRCDALHDRALDCGYAPGAATPEDDQSACEDARTILGTQRFDDYADCLDKSGCDDTELQDACLASATDDDCERFVAWAAGCGLEPAGTADNCSGLNDNLGPAFGDWVTCMTAGGCPTTDDERFDVCQQSIAPGGVTNLIDACTLITGWVDRCQGVALELPIEAGNDFPSCLAQAQYFTAESYYAYGVCLDAIECDDIVGRLQCFFELDFIDITSSRDACEELVDFSATCGSELGGQSQDACERIFARFDPASVQGFVDCVTGLECGDPQAVPTCGPLLQLQ